MLIGVWSMRKTLAEMKQTLTEMKKTVGLIDKKTDNIEAKKEEIEMDKLDKLKGHMETMDGTIAMMERGLKALTDARPGLEQPSAPQLPQLMSVSETSRREASGCSSTSSATVRGPTVFPPHNQPCFCDRCENVFNTAFYNQRTSTPLVPGRVSVPLQIIRTMSRTNSKNVAQSNPE